MILLVEAGGRSFYCTLKEKLQEKCKNLQENAMKSYSGK